MKEIVLTKEEETEFRKWLIDKGYTKDITKEQMTNEYNLFIAFSVLFK